MKKVIVTTALLVGFSLVSANSFACDPTDPGCNDVADWGNGWLNTYQLQDRVSQMGPSESFTAGFGEQCLTGGGYAGPDTTVRIQGSVLQYDLWDETNDGGDMNHFGSAFMEMNGAAETDGDCKELKIDMNSWRGHEAGSVKGGNYLGSFSDNNAGVDAVLSGANLEWGFNLEQHNGYQLNGVNFGQMGIGSVWINGGNLPETEE